MAVGWKQQSLQVPDSFHAAFREEAARWGQSSVKLLGTIAIGVLMGLPKDARREFYFWIIRVQHDPDQELTIGAVFDQMMDLLAMEGEVWRHNQPPSGDNIDVERNGWKVDRIASPYPSLIDLARRKFEEEDERSHR